VVVAGGIVGAVAAVLAALVAGRVVGAVAGRPGTIVALLVAAVVMAPVDATVVGAVAGRAGAALVVATLVVDAVVIATVVADGIVGAVARLRRPGTAGGERRDGADRQDAAVQTGQGNAPSSWGLCRHRRWQAHLTSAFRRIGATNRVEAALWARQNGLT
jgi:hypothetical protein